MHLRLRVSSKICSSKENIWCWRIGKLEMQLWSVILETFPMTDGRNKLERFSRASFFHTRLIFTVRSLCLPLSSICTHNYLSVSLSLCLSVSLSLCLSVSLSLCLSVSLSLCLSVSLSLCLSVSLSLFNLRLQLATVIYDCNLQL